MMYHEVVLKKNMGTIKVLFISLYLFYSYLFWLTMKNITDWFKKKYVSDKSGDFYTSEQAFTCNKDHLTGYLQHVLSTKFFR